MEASFAVLQPKKQNRCTDLCNGFTDFLRG